MNGQTGKKADGQRANGVSSGSDFRKQMLWLKAQEFAEQVAALVADLPHDRAADVIGTQLLRSATSIAANIAEGYGRFSQPAYRNHLSIARGSAFESESWIDLLMRRKYVPFETGEAQIATCVEVQKLVTVRMKSLADGKTYAVREESDEAYHI
ncbi:MAG TPA: four helix bundle protein [Dehalococcoidia bacterium]|nr:four helix bundle protein [Dehalococcoidia bacterium]